MHTNFVIPNVPAHLQRNRGSVQVLVAAGETSRVRRTREQFGRGRIKYSAETQPRDSSGKFRQILARLKTNLGDKELQSIVAEIKSAEAADDAGDYGKASEAGRNVIKLVDGIESGSIDSSVENNLRKGAADLGRVLAYLPLPQGENSAKVRFSDLPPSAGQLIQNLIERVENEVKSADAQKFVKILKNFISGGRTMSSDELSAEMNKLLRLLA
jgi:hypothetical protein